MSDTVLVALITFASGFFGVLVGAVANYKISKLGVRADKSKLLHDEKMIKYSELVSAYHELVRIYAEIANGFRIDVDRTVDSAVRFFNAYGSAALLASPKVIQALKDIDAELSEMTKTCKPPADTNRFDALVGAMREDLLSFSHGEGKG